MAVFAVRHKTTYRYRSPVAFGEHRLMFRPRDSADQRLIEAQLKVSPEPRSVRWIHDVFGNCVALVAFDGCARQLDFETYISVEHAALNEPDFRIDADALTYPFSYGEEEAADLAPTRAMQHSDDTVRRWARRFVKEGCPTETGHLLMTMCYGIHESFVYSRRYEAGTQAPALTLERRKGTCRDFALLMIEALRSLGFAARFVSGYIYVPGRDRADVRGGGSTHAWAQVYLPGAGWIEFDPTNGIIGSRDLIRVAVARNPEQARPLSGTFDGAANAFAGMDVEVKVTTERDRQSPASLFAAEEQI
jgi:transglutaminase-like putative cysteine protease